jgi:hypothetical protein
VPASAVVVAWAVAVDLGASECSGAMLISIWATSSVVLRQSRAGQVHHTLSKARSASSSIGRWATPNPLVTFQ